MRSVNLTEKEILDILGLVKNEINYVEDQIENYNEMFYESYLKRLKSIKNELENKI